MKLIEGKELRRRLGASPALIEGLVDADVQVQMNGVDFTLREVARFRDEAGAIDFDNSERRVPGTDPVPVDEKGWWFLEPGLYWIVYNEVVNIPPDAFAIGRTRSSVLRSGASIKTALWDSGYSGRSGSLLVVHNPAGLRLQKNARIMQLVFFGLDMPAEKTYAGQYQNENKSVTLCWMGSRAVKQPAVKCGPELASGPPTSKQSHRSIRLPRRPRCRAGILLTTPGASPPS